MLSHLSFTSAGILADFIDGKKTHYRFCSNEEYICYEPIPVNVYGKTLKYIDRGYNTNSVQFISLECEDGVFLFLLGKDRHISLVGKNIRSIEKCLNSFETLMLKYEAVVKISAEISSRVEEKTVEFGGVYHGFYSYMPSEKLPPFKLWMQENNIYIHFEQVLNNPFYRERKLL